MSHKSRTVKRVLQNNRENKISLPAVKLEEVEESGGKKKRLVQWRDAYVLVKVPVQVAVTDKRVRQWVQDAMNHYNESKPYNSLAEYCQPSMVGKPTAKEFHRYVRAKQVSASWKNRAVRDSEELPDEIQ